MSGAWDDETTERGEAVPSPAPAPSSSSMVPPKPQSQQMQAALLGALLGPQSTALDSHPSHPPSSSDSPQLDVNGDPIQNLSAQLNLMMSRPGAPKLKLLRRAPAGQQQQQQTTGGAADHADSSLSREELEAKSAEQREREYEQARAAIFGELEREAAAAEGAATTADGQQTAMAAQSNASTTAAPVFSSLAASAPIAHASPSPSPSAPAPAASAASSSSPSPSSSAPSSRKSVRGGAPGQTHRIIEDLVGNRASSTRHLAGQEKSDPDYVRRRKPQPQQQQQHWGYPYGQPPTNYYAYPHPQQQKQHLQQFQQAYGAQPYTAHFVPPPSGGGGLLPYPTPSTGPGGAHYAQGPQGNSVGFGRGQPMQPHAQGAHPSFNPSAVPFYPGQQPVYPVHPSNQHQQQHKQRYGAQAYPPQGNANPHMHAHAQQQQYGQAYAGAAPSFRTPSPSTSPSPPVSAAPPSSSSSPAPSLQDESEFPALSSNAPASARHTKRTGADASATAAATSR